MVVLLPHTCQQTMVNASLWVGLVLPGMIDDPSSLLGRINSPRTERGPEPRRRMSFAILKSAVAAELIAPCTNTYASCAAMCSNLLGALVKGSPVNFAMRRAMACANCGLELIPVP